MSSPLRPPSAQAQARRDAALVARAVQQAGAAITTTSCDTAAALSTVGSMGSMATLASADAAGPADASAPRPPSPSPSQQQLEALAESGGGCVLGSLADGGVGPPPADLCEALFALMNNPHPLDILASSRAYGSGGSVSRYHDPAHYTLAVAGVLRARGPAWQRLMRHASSAGLRWHAPSLEPRAVPPPAAGRLQRAQRKLLEGRVEAVHALDGLLD